MSLASNRQATIVRTEWGLTIANTRITLYDVMDYVIAHYPPKLIGDILNLSQAQTNAALSYIEANRTEVEAEYQTILQEAEEIRQYWQERNREHDARIAKLPSSPEREALRAKLQAQRANRAKA